VAIYTGTDLASTPASPTLRPNAIDHDSFIFDLKMDGNALTDQEMTFPEHYFPRTSNSHWQSC